MPDVDTLINELSHLRFDVENKDGNSRLISQVEEAADALAAFIKDDSDERALLQEFEHLHKAICLKHTAERSAADASLDSYIVLIGANEELKMLQDEHERLSEELRKLKVTYNEKIGSGDDAIAATKEKQELKNKLSQLRGTEDELLLEVQSMKHKLQLLEDAAEMQKAAKADVIKRDRIMYEFLTSTLNITVINATDTHVQLALLSESDDRTTQTWDCVTVKRDECDSHTTELIWQAIERTFNHGTQQETPESALETVRFSI
ncbi:uncharacterized protein BXIN_1798 [Babesia sp. Xinjiang]|uniref:uncharacterized protein n=1 Tax=Babesia sp. Xinjiang TaxID=462227 RepID=UPI000A26400C|nr:uncharacterized protein BXIN_1621 [Babesia sp. Xinjiang]XP_028871450.1 uncharacterized protein BXIN_1798 [Babesia sp. Xinjiang]ORM40854.1 hypothetical protein BXIN_1621 [Babesia sp. Xinjiang]ORM40994.1 hypothetical protein BXIN_1798 [Babesia sp. Xinjiang]